MANDRQKASLLEATLTAFGEDVVYTKVGGEPVTIQGVFSRVYIESLSVDTLTSTLRIRLSDLTSSPARGDALTVDGMDFTVRSSEPDLLGGTTLILDKA